MSSYIEGITEEDIDQMREEAEALGRKKLEEELKAAQSQIENDQSLQVSDLSHAVIERNLLVDGAVKAVLEEFKTLSKKVPDESIVNQLRLSLASKTYSADDLREMAQEDSEAKVVIAGAIHAKANKEGKLREKEDLPYGSPISVNSGATNETALANFKLMHGRDPRDGEDYSKYAMYGRKQ